MYLITQFREHKDVGKWKFASPHHCALPVATEWGGVLLIMQFLLVLTTESGFVGAKTHFANLLKH